MEKVAKIIIISSWILSLLLLMISIGQYIMLKQVEWIYISIFVLCINTAILNWIYKLKKHK